MSAPAVSVVMPVRDGAAHLAEAVGSILGQSCPEFELIAIDDGSRDGSPALLAQHAARDARVRVITQPRLGLVAALNRGLAEAAAPIVARMDADDVAAPVRLERQLAALRAAPQAAVVGSGWRVLRHGTVRRVVQPPTSAAAVLAALARCNCMGHPTVAMRRDAVRTVGGYRPAFRLAEDYDLWLRLAERYALINLPEPLLDYREHDAQASWTDIEQRIVSEMAAVAAAAARRSGQPDHMDRPEPAERTDLIRLGMSERTIAEGVVARALGTAKDALAASQPGAARAAVSLLLRQAGLHPRTRVHGWLLRLRCLSG